jgi:predicted AlkP superfamily phosphohydrolase/phosphomutase
VVLGIDGLDAGYIEAHLDELSNLRSFAVVDPLPSIFPPDSIPAWLTIFTGEPPDSHGVIESIDYLAKNPASAVEDAPNFLRGRTFWDAASARGRRVCVVNPFMAYPAWEVNGAMVAGPVFVEADGASIYPEDAAAGLTLPQLGGIVDFPTPETMGDFLEASLLTTSEQARFGLALLERSQPDLFFMNILTIDRIQHFLWRYCDPGDPTYPGPNDLDDGVDRAYRLVDELIGEFAAAAGDGQVIVISDHGHARRPTTMFFVDELLRRNGLFQTGGVRKTLRTFAIEKAKRAALKTAYYLRREHEVYRFARRLPGRKALKHAAYARGSGSVATVSRAFGRNSAGGIEIADWVDPEERARLSERICTLMRETRAPDGQPACEWVRPRGEVFEGPAASIYPDVLFQLRDDIGVDFGVFGRLFGIDPLHRRISGGHRPNGVFAARSRDLPFVPKSLDEIHDLVLKAMM